jgi:hypothetical protein
MALLPVPYVPRLDAISVDGVMRTGRTRPLLLHCASISNHELTPYVVKLYGDASLGHRCLARELFGTLLGQVFGFRVPRAAIIDVHQGLSQGVGEPAMREKIQRSPGLNFGSEYLQGAISFSYLPESHLQLAAEVFAFDMLIQNLDRRKGNPNMFQDCDGLIMYDHEMAFPYASPEMMVDGVPEPGVLDRGEPIIKNHALYDWLKKGLKRGDTIKFDAFIDKLKDLSGDVMDAIVDRVPTGWRTEELLVIRSYLLQVRDRAPRFKRSLQEVLG